MLGELGKLEEGVSLIRRQEEGTAFADRLVEGEVVDGDFSLVDLASAKHKSIIINK